MNYRPSNNSMVPPVVKNLLIINGLFFVAKLFFASRGIALEGCLGMFYFDSPYFRPWQIFTHMFMHGDLMHIFFNMFAVWMFGSKLEIVWGPKRFLFFYFITGLGAALMHQAWNGFGVYQAMGTLTPYSSGMNLTTVVDQILYTPVVGASGALFGVLGGFAMLFPNTELMLIFFPVPIKAKYFVAIYGAIELWTGIANNAGDNMAHFAHLGGLIVGLLLVLYWNKNNRETFY